MTLPNSVPFHFPLSSEGGIYKYNKKHVFSPSFLFHLNQCQVSRFLVFAVISAQRHFHDNKVFNLLL